MTEPSKPRYSLTRDEAVALRELGRMARTGAGAESNLYYRYQ